VKQKNVQYLNQVNQTFPYSSAAIIASSSSIPLGKNCVVKFSSPDSVTTISSSIRIPPTFLYRSRVGASMCCAMFGSALEESG